MYRNFQRIGEGEVRWILQVGGAGNRHVAATAVERQNLVRRLGKASEGQRVEGDSAKQEAEADVGVPGVFHDFMVPWRNHEPGQKKGRELNAPLSRGTAKRPCKEMRQAAPDLGACSARPLHLKIRGFLERP